MEPEPAPKISAVLVAYNRAEQLPATLDSILAQGLRDFELIVSDDCSTDATPQVCAAYAARDPRLRYRRNPTNLRMPGNLNAAIAEARGEYLAILHDGDEYREDLFEKAAAVLDRHPGAAFAFNAYELALRGGRTRVDRVEMPECMDGHEFLRRVYLPSWGGCPVYGTTVIRRSCLQAVGPFDPRFSMHSDIEMWVRLAARYDVAYVPEPLMKLRSREAGHLLDRHFWWERTVDVRAKRLALRAAGASALRRLAFELRARLHYAGRTLVPLKRGQWSGVATGLFLAATGRDEVAPPY